MKTALKLGAGRGDTSFEVLGESVCSCEWPVKGNSVRVRRSGEELQRVSGSS